MTVHLYLMLRSRTGLLYLDIQPPCTSSWKVILLLLLLLKNAESLFPELREPENSEGEEKAV
jgi:hypothetical protein